MRKGMSIGVAASLVSILGQHGPLYAQKGVAPNGYWPLSYQGSTFTGAVESATNDPQELTLTYTKKGNSEKFTGRLEAPCQWTGKDGTVHKLKPTDIPKGTQVTVYYKGVVESHPETRYVFAISYTEYARRKLPEEERFIVACTTDKMSYFKTFRP
jgi:hypothetical protein